MTDGDLAYRGADLMLAAALLLARTPPRSVGAPLDVVRRQRVDTTECLDIAERVVATVRIGGEVAGADVQSLRDAAAKIPRARWARRHDEVLEEWIGQCEGGPVAPVDR